MPVLSIIPSAQVAKKDLDNCKEFCIKYQHIINTKEYIFKQFVKENTEISKNIKLYKIMLMSLFKNYQKTRVWMTFSSWHSFCLFSMLNYMSDQLQNQRYLQVDLQMKLMDTLTRRGISQQYSNFLISTYQSDFQKRSQIVFQNTALLKSLFNKIQYNSNKRICQNYLEKWYTTACNNRALYEKCEKELQLVKFSQKLTNRASQNKSFAIENLRNDMITKKTKICLYAIILTVF